MIPSTIKYIFTAWALAAVVLAQNLTPEEFCKRQNPNYKPVMEANGSFNGRCEMEDSTLCLGDEFTTPKGKVLCCLGGTVMAVDSSTKEAACCPSGKEYRNWACSDPTPQINCPGSNGQWVNKNGVNFQVWCQRNIIEYTDPFDWSGKFAAVMNFNQRGVATFQDCLDGCAANPKCQGANWWYGKGLCGFNVMKQGGSIFARGGDYRNPPQVAWMDPRVIAMVAVPKR